MSSFVGCARPTDSNSFRSGLSERSCVPSYTSLGPALATLRCTLTRPVLSKFPVFSYEQEISGLDRKVVRVGPACRAGHGVIQNATRGLELQPEPVCLLPDRFTIKTKSANPRHFTGVLERSARGCILPILSSARFGTRFSCFGLVAAWVFEHTTAPFSRADRFNFLVFDTMAATEP